MAFIYLSGGVVLNVSASRDAIEIDLERADDATLLHYDVDFPTGGAKQAAPVTVIARHVVAVSQQVIPDAFGR